MQNNKVQLRPTEPSDLERLYEFQLDAEANYLAAFTSTNQHDKEAYLKKFSRFLHDPTINKHTILVDEIIVGSIAKFELDGKAEITYWIDRSCWGQGIATSALQELVSVEGARPLLGRVAFDNVGSQRILEKCGFVSIGTDKGFANARGTETEEFIYSLA